MSDAEAKYRGLLEAAPDAIVGVSADGRIALVNAQTERLFGYSRGDLIGQPVEMLVPDSVREIHPDHRSRYVADPHPRPMGAGMELAGRRKDGSEFRAEISLSAFETDEGLLVSAAIRDVTDRRRAAEAQAQLASIIRSSHDAVIGKTAEGIITIWNPGAQRLYGYTSEEVVGSHIDVLVPPELRGEERALLNRIAQGERIEQFRAERVRKDGSVVTVSTTMSPIADTRGAIVGVASVSRDIGERERAEARFRGLLEAAPDAMVCVDADGCIALVNAQAERLFGYGRDDMVGQPVELLVPERVQAVHPRHRTGYFVDPQPRPMGAGMELAGRHKDGTEFPAEISLSALETDEGTLVSATIRDVTERVEAQAERERLKAQAERERLESQLHQPQRLESLGQLAGGVAHDFNNLLAVILNYASFVAEGVNAAAAEEGGERWETAAEDLEQIRRAAERATGLTHQLLAFGRREVVRPQVLSLNDVVRGVEQLLRRTIGEDVELSISLDPGLWPVLADPGQMEQVLVNLAVNARDAMPTGGTLRIDSANITVDEGYAAQRPGLTPGRHARLRVSDTSTGMDREVLGRVFEPFFTTKAKGEGSGLGLATVYGIITRAGGSAQLYSEPGLGTTFTALLPATEQEVAAADHVLGEEHRPRGGETVLVVEDEDEDGGDPPHPRPQRLRGAHGWRRARGHRTGHGPRRRHRPPEHRRRDAPDARQGGRHEAAGAPARAAAALHVGVRTARPRFQGHPRGGHCPAREAVLRAGAPRQGP
jgi:two-component system, cell cycle sensor histidine kinase and response regulator CckA